jgi:hypothetical protein
MLRYLLLKLLTGGFAAMRTHVSDRQLFRSMLFVRRAVNLLRTAVWHLLMAIQWQKHALKQKRYKIFWRPTFSEQAVAAVTAEKCGTGFLILNL